MRTASATVRAIKRACCVRKTESEYALSQSIHSLTSVMLLCRSGRREREADERRTNEQRSRLFKSAARPGGPVAE